MVMVIGVLRVIATKTLTCHLRIDTRQPSSGTSDSPADYANKLDWDNMIIWMMETTPTSWIGILIMIILYDHMETTPTS